MFKGLKAAVALPVTVPVVALSALTMVASAQPITYQGQLLFDGELAGGIFDLECKIFDAAFGGSQVGETVLLEDQLVQGGVLSTLLDFGDAFDASDSYLSISIRLGESEDAFTTLAPRQLLTPAPKAIHALTADALLAGGWSEGGTSIGGGSILRFGDGFDRVVINRDSLLTPVEYFGVHIDNPDASGVIGGIVISNAGAANKTLLAHATGGVIGASEIYNGETHTWTLQIGMADILSVKASGITAPNYSYAAPKAQGTTVAGDLFHSALGTPFIASFFSGGAYITQAGTNTPMLAPITLPNGATVTKLTARFEDNAPGDLTITLVGAKSDGTLVTVASVASTSMMVAGLRTVTAPEILEPTPIDTISTGYYLRAFCSSWPGNSSIRIWSVSVEYTVDAPN